MKKEEISGCKKRAGRSREKSMAAKKVYAVRKGKKTGVFYSWAECKASVDGYPGAEYKGFSTVEEARAFLNREAGRVYTAKEAKESGQSGELPKEGMLLSYVDGSYEDSIKKYAFGCVFLLPDGRIFTEFGNGDNEQSAQLRNVTGEMLGAMYAVKCAMANGFSEIEIRYDYQGIEKWVTGDWKAKTELTRKYAAAMQGWGRKLRIHFTKVPAHSNVKFNELADKLAKTGLLEGNGVPAARPFEEMTEYFE